MQCLNAYNLKLFIYVQNMQCRPLLWEDKIEHVGMQLFIRYAFEQCINSYQIHSWPKIAVLMAFEAKKSMNLISISGCRSLHALKINKLYSKMTPLLQWSTQMSVYYINQIFFTEPIFYDENI